MRSTIHRAPTESFPETVTWLCDLLQVDRRVATFLVWDVCTKIGTDRHHWIDTDRAHRYIADAIQSERPDLPAARA